MTPLYCTIRQAIELTGTNKKRLNEWIKDGLPIYRPPGKTALVRVADLDEYIRQHRVDVQVTSDMGSFVFSRVHDMFTFFRSPDMKINPGYWSVKIVAEDKHGGVEKFSVEKFHEAVLCHTRDYLDLEEGAEIPEDIMDEIDPLVETYDEYDCVEAMLDFYSDRIKFDDFWEHNLKEYNYCYIWCLYAIVHVISRYDDVSGSAQAVS